MRQTAALIILSGSITMVCTAAPDAPGVTIAARIDTASTGRFWGFDPIHGNRKVFSRLHVYPAEAKTTGLRLNVSAGQAVLPTDTLALTVRSMFAQTSAIVRRRVPGGIAAGDAASWTVELSPQDVPFTEGAYHIVVDILRDDQSLAGPNVGSVFYVLARKGRSLGYVSATYQIAYLDLMKDPQTGSTPNLFPMDRHIPPTFDPYAPATRQAWLDMLTEPLATSQRESWRKAAQSARRRDATIPAELVADGGTGILFGLLAYRAMGETNLERFAFRVLRGFVTERIRKGKSVPHVNQSWHVVRLLSYAVVALRDMPEYHDWVEKVLAEDIPLQLKDTITYDPAVGGTARGHIPTFAHKTIVVDGHKLTREPYRDGTYVGRVYGGHAWYQLAHLLVRGAEAKALAEPIERIIDFGAQEAQWLVDNQDETHGRYGNMCGSYNLCFGLVAAHHLARMNRRQAQAALIAQGIRTALQSAIHEPEYGPNFEGWLDADGYTLCEMAIRILGEDASVRQAQRRFTSDADADIAVPGQAARNEPYGLGHRVSTIAPMLLSSPEYAQAVQGGAPKWQELLPPD